MSPKESSKSNNKKETPPQKDSSQETENLDFDQEEIKAYYQRRNFELKWLTAIAWTSFLTGNAPLIIGASILAYFRSLKSQWDEKKLTQKERAKLLQRIDIELKKLAQNQGTITKIDWVSLEPNWKTLDYLIFTQNQQLFLLSCQSFLPDIPKSRFHKPYYLFPDPLKQLIQDLNIFKTTPPEPSYLSLTGILVLGNPITIVDPPLDYYRQLGAERYLQIHKIYIVEESRLITLISELIALEDV